MPYAKYAGRWSYKPKAAQKESADSLRKFHAYLVQLQENETALSEIDVQRFAIDLANGLWFDSNIPTGYGLGSSGSLCAAVYDAYGLNKIDNTPSISSKQLIKLKAIFAQLESCFHGASSGADPLVCYLGQPVLMSPQELKTIELPATNNGDGAIFLLNTKIPRKTAPLVNIFLKKCEDPAFERLCTTELVHYSDESMDAFLQGDIPAVFENVRLLSAFQYEHFQPMIPEAFREIWQHGLDTNAYTLKLCGAGGGGFILGFAKDYALVRRVLERYELEVVFSF